ncbi:hypothetical protein JQ615_39335 [Bradyrhizobium jicamae]|uniref:Uncharacterized protein n=1 Tax=Bradyrhizobium jicamae TaxID=280332 RepID=A0ABS5FX97_9BRAD|nr:hypothetical protein [Bradyrhizobium jicamae]MBR0801418.1 hypothetical protein [Bradyrhizobium jicamae]MBR0937800.1 hypothetical protein [Bradyrhizobium jicamae]
MAADDGLSAVPDSDSADSGAKRLAGRQRKNAFDDQAAQRRDLVICQGCVASQSKAQ